jgi:hypothetical protein
MRVARGRVVLHTLGISDNCQEHTANGRKLLAGRPVLHLELLVSDLYKSGAAEQFSPLA